MNNIETFGYRLERIQRTSLTVGIGGLILCLVIGLLISGREQVFQSYLFGYIYWIQIVLGCIGVILLHYLVGGAWGFSVRRLLESGAMTLPVMIILFIPILLGLNAIYEWADAEAVAANSLLQHKTVYLNIEFFVLRSVIYFVIWFAFAFAYSKWSLAQDKTGDASLTARMKQLSGPGMVIYVLACTFAAFDWGMSTDAEWFSSIYGVLFIVGQGLSTFAFAIVAMKVLSNHDKALSKVASPSNFSDLGNLMFAFTILWAYITFSQFLIIWSANLPEEIGWYLDRSQGGWQWIILLVIIFHFLFPFFILLNRTVKRSARILPVIAAFVLVMRLVETFWLISPTFNQGALQIHWLDIAAPVTIGAIWFSAFIGQIKRKPLVPLQDPHYGGALS